MTQAQILPWLGGKPQIGQNTGGKGAGSCILQGESQTVGGRVRSLSGQLFSSGASVLSPQGGRRGPGVWSEPKPAV